MPSGTYIRTLEILKKMSESHKGIPNTKEQKLKISKALKGKKKPPRSEEHKRKIGEFHKGKKWFSGKSHTIETKKKMSLARLGIKRKPFTEETLRKMSEAQKGKLHLERRGEKSIHWIKDRTRLKTDRRKAYDYRYKDWMLNVKKRDSWKCKINNNDCKGRLESHHILNWVDYSELRYEINNGITLCHFHHPIKWEEEKRLSSYFIELINQSKLI